MITAVLYRTRTFLKRTYVYINVILIFNFIWMYYSKKTYECHILHCSESFTYTYWIALKTQYSIRPLKCTRKKRMNTDDIAIGPFHIYQRTDKMSKKEKYLYPLLFLSLFYGDIYVCIYIYIK